MNNYRPFDTLIKGRQRALLLGEGQGKKPGSATRLLLLVHLCILHGGLHACILYSREISDKSAVCQTTVQCHPMRIVLVVLICPTWEICFTFCKHIVNNISFENVKHISHVVQIKPTKIIRMGWHCSIVCCTAIVPQCL